MVQTASPVTGGPVMEEADWSDLIVAALNQGVIRGILLELQCYTDADGRQVKVRSGIANVHGKLFRSTATEVIALGTNTSGADRFDRIVVRLNESASSHTVPNTSTVIPARTAKIVVVPGTPSAPALATGSSGIWDIPIATVELDNGYTTVTSGKITENRVFAQGGADSLGRLSLRGDQNAVLFESFDGTDRFLVGLRSDFGGADDFFLQSYGGDFNWRTGATVVAKLDMTNNVFGVGDNADGGTGTAVQIGDFGDTSNGHVRVVSSSSNAGLVLRSKGTTQGTSSAIFLQDSGGVTSAYFTVSNGLSDTWTTLVLGRQLGGAYSLQRVVQGAADSGGSGFRQLVVPN